MDAVSWSYRFKPQIWDGCPAASPDDRPSTINTHDQFTASCPHLSHPAVKSRLWIGLRSSPSIPLLKAHLACQSSPKRLPPLSA